MAKAKSAYGRGRHPNSRKNLVPPAKPGEVRNPLGINRKHPYTDAYRITADGVLPERIRNAINNLMREPEYIQTPAGLRPNPHYDPKQKDFEFLPRGVTWRDAMSVRMHIEAVMKGSVFAANHLVENIEGRPVQRVQIDAGEDPLMKLIEGMAAKSKELGKPEGTDEPKPADP